MPCQAPWSGEDRVAPGAQWRLEEFLRFSGRRGPEGHSWGSTLAGGVALRSAASLAIASAHFGSSHWFQSALPVSPLSEMWQCECQGVYKKNCRRCTFRVLFKSALMFAGQNLLELSNSLELEVLILSSLLCCCLRKSRLTRLIGAPGPAPKPSSELELQTSNSLRLPHQLSSPDTY
jgi:hypothetical protein